MGCCSVCQQSCKDCYQCFLVCFSCREGVLCPGLFVCMYVYINTYFGCTLSCCEPFDDWVLFREMSSKWKMSLVPVSWRCCRDLQKVKCVHKFPRRTWDLAKIGACLSPGRWWVCETAPLQIAEISVLETPRLQGVFGWFYALLLFHARK